MYVHVYVCIYIYIYTYTTCGLVGGARGPVEARLAPLGAARLINGNICVYTYILYKKHRYVYFIKGICISYKHRLNIVNIYIYIY